MFILLKNFASRNSYFTAQSLLIRFKSYTPPFTQEFTVSPFSNLQIDCNFNVALQPLNVSKYINQDRIIVNMICHKKTNLSTVLCEQNGNDIAIKSDGNFVDCLCIVEAPLKANFDVVVKDSACVSVGSFENDYLRIKTDAGNVEVDKFQSGNVDVSTESGDISCRRNTQAANICLKTKSGRIKTDKLQGKNLNIRTESGNISTQASYCDKSSFESTKGSLYLQNVHKSCKIAVEEGYVSLLVFDGILELLLKRGKADVLLSRILGDSSICIENDGCLNLKIVENCFNDTGFNFKTNDFRSIIDFFKNDDSIVIKPKLKQENVVSVICKTVNIENVSVLELFRLLK